MRTSANSSLPVIARAAAVALLSLLFSFQTSQAQPTGTPRQLIDRLGVTIREILEDPESKTTPAEAERLAASQITALITNSPGHLSLTELDGRGRTPLMFAVSGGYPQIVHALLADPSVKLAINVPDERGQTPWMLANFAPTATLMACEPGTLTIERYQLLPPYIRRLANLLKTNQDAITGIVRELEAAGAEVKPDEAKRVWLARCPNAAPELREALAKGQLLPVLLQDSLNRLGEFNKAAEDHPITLSASPPDDMKFVREEDEKPPKGAVSLLNIGGMTCPKKPHPKLPARIHWSGEILFRAVVVTRAGVVEGVDFTVLSGPKDRRLLAGFRSIMLDALAGYQCYGDHVFEQEFQFHIQ